MPISKRKCVFFFLTWLQSWIIHYSDLPRRGVRGLRVPDTPLPPFPPHLFFFSVLAPTYADNWIENVASQAIGLSGN